MSTQVMRLERWATNGLLLVCALLAAALTVTAILSHRAATAAARSVLHSRAVEVANSLGAVVRLMPSRQPDDLQHLVEDYADKEVGVAICDMNGKVLAASGGPDPLAVGATTRSSAWVTLRELRSRGQAYSMEQQGGAEFLQYWQPIRGPRPGRPPPEGWDRERVGGRWWWKREPRHIGPRWGPHHRLRLVRVTVATSVADNLVSPARFTLILAGGAAGLLLVLGFVMHRAAARARQTQQELQRRRALSALGEMAAVLAHEIRTPLASIKGNAQLVGEGHPDDRRIEAVVQEAGRLERLVNGLLDYARPAEPVRTRSDPDEIAERAAQIVAPKAEDAGVMLMTDPAQCGPCLWADPDQLLQVLVNLLQNGVEAYGQAGTADRPGVAGGSGGRPRSVVLRVRSGRGSVIFTVLDSGPGLDEAAADQLLQPFHSTKHQGTGLGLSVARQIVEQHGGELRLSNRKEGGAQVEVRLPERQK
jgi:signal transduction histidine kinase